MKSYIFWHCILTTQDTVQCIQTIAHDELAKYHCAMLLAFWQEQSPGKMIS